MLISFLGKTKHGDAHAVYEHICDLAPEDKSRFVFYEVRNSNRIKSDIAIVDRDCSDHVSMVEATTLIGFGGCPTAKACMAAHRPEKDRIKAGGYSKAVVVGSPSLDVLHGTRDEKEALRLIFLRYNGLYEDRSTVLYAPARMAINGDANSRRLKTIRVIAEQTEKLSLNLIVRLARSSKEITEFVESLENAHLSIISEETDAAALLIGSDVLITDYSLLAVDYLNLNRPMVFTSRPSKDSPWCFSKMVPGKLVDSIKQINIAITEFKNRKDRFEKAKRLKFRKWFVPFGDGQDCERVVDLIMETHK